MKISVLIVVHNSLRNTEGIINSIKQVSSKNWEIDFFIVNTDRFLDKNIEMLLEKHDFYDVRQVKYPNLMWAEALQRFLLSDEGKKNILHINSDVELNNSVLKKELAYIGEEFDDKMFYVGLIKSSSGEMYGFKKYKNNKFINSMFSDFSVFNFNFVLFNQERVRILLPNKPFKQAFLDYYISMQITSNFILKPNGVVGSDKNLQNKLNVSKNSQFYKSRVNIIDSYRFYSTFRSVPYAIILCVYLGVFK